MSFEPAGCCKTLMHWCCDIFVKRLFCTQFLVGQSICRATLLQRHLFCQATLFGLFFLRYFADDDGGVDNKEFINNLNLKSERRQSPPCPCRGPCLHIIPTGCGCGGSASGDALEECVNTSQGRTFWWKWIWEVGRRISTFNTHRSNSRISAMWTTVYRLCLQW